MKTREELVNKVVETRKAASKAEKVSIEADQAYEEAITQLAEFDKMWLEEHNLKLERSIFNEEA